MMETWATLVAYVQIRREGEMTGIAKGGCVKGRVAGFFGVLLASCTAIAASDMLPSYGTVGRPQRAAGASVRQYEIAAGEQGVARLIADSGVARTMRLAEAAAGGAPAPAGTGGRPPLGRSLGGGVTGTDVAVIDVHIEPATVVTGEPIDVRFTVANLGRTTVVEANCRITLRVIQRVHARDRDYELDVAVVRNLRPGESRTMTRRLTVPWYVAKGRAHYIGVRAAVGRDLPETDSANNYSGVQVGLEPGALPDLTVSALELWPKTPITAATPFHVNVTIRNVGSREAPPTRYHVVRQERRLKGREHEPCWYSDDRHRPPDIADTGYMTPMLARGSAMRRRFDFTPAPAGTHTTIAVVVNRDQDAYPEERRGGSQPSGPDNNVAVVCIEVPE
jgi:hypothetical protein